MGGVLRGMGAWVGVCFMRDRAWGLRGGGGGFVGWGVVRGGWVVGVEDRVDGEGCRWERRGERRSEKEI